MRRIAKAVFRFLPVQLVLLHFRKYQLLLVFWLILIATVTGHFASTFGAATLFLSPEYLGKINFTSMFLLGGAMAVFVMAWHITTFIIHSQRVPFMGATRHAFLKYCINNSIIPLAFLIAYSIISIRFQFFNEHASASGILKFQLGFYLGFLLIILISFAYFFRVDRDLLKVVLSNITNPARIREIIPYDSLDYDIDIIHADTYVTGKLRIKKCSELEPYHPRLLHMVLRKHHRNAITATIFAIALLLLSGAFIDEPRLRIPAGAGFLILFSIVMGLVGAMKYFLRSWEIFGWLFIAIFLSVLVNLHWFDLRSIAYGLDYHTAENQKPAYDYESLRKFFTPSRYEADKKTEERRLDKWKQKQMAGGDTMPPLIILTVSGGGSRAAYWSFHTLQYLDSISKGKLFNNTVLLTGASGGMIGASYWRELHSAALDGKIKDPYNSQYQENVGKDLLNAIIFSFVSVDLISPFNKISLSGYSYSKDRGYAMEQEMIRNTEGLLDRKIGDSKEKEDAGTIPGMIVNGTIINDGRKLMMTAQPVSYLTMPENALYNVQPAIDAIDCGAFFEKQNGYNMRLSTALRMNATFPFVLPVVRMPSQPSMNIMDAGLRDNFGTEVASRYIYVLRNWIIKNTRKVIFIQIRDTKEHDIFPPSAMGSLGSMLSDPLFVIQDKWEPFQSYNQGYLKDYAPYFMPDKLHFVTFEYIPDQKSKAAALNFHLTKREKIDILNSINNSTNQAAAKQLMQLLQ